MNQIIVISGDLGSGKTSVAKLLSTRLAIDHISVGMMYRKVAKEMGMNSLEFNLHAETNHNIDRYFDSVLLSLIDDKDYIVESRTAWHQLKGSVKVYLKVDPDIGAERVRRDMNRQNDPIYESHEHAITRLRARKESENRRYLASYGIDVDDLKYYDVVIDTSNLTVEQIVHQLLSIAKESGK
jgi:cytidylate kinase